MAAWRLGHITGILTSLVYGYLLFGLCGGQCPEQSPALENKVAESDVLVQAQVKRHYRVNAGDKGYTAELDVWCVFKGGPLPAVLNVTRAGEQGGCEVAKLPEGAKNLVYLRRSGGNDNPTFTPMFAEDPAETKYLEELRYSCSLSVQLPTGVTVDKTGYCEHDKFTADSYADDCLESSSAPNGGSVTAIRRSSLWTLVCAIGGVLLSCSMLRSVS